MAGTTANCVAAHCHVVVGCGSLSKMEVSEDSGDVMEVQAESSESSQDSSIYIE